MANKVQKQGNTCPHLRSVWREFAQNSRHMASDVDFRSSCVGFSDFRCRGLRLGLGLGAWGTGCTLGHLEVACMDVGSYIIGVVYRP